MRLSGRTLRPWHSGYLVHRSLWKHIGEAVRRTLPAAGLPGWLVLDVGCGKKPYADHFAGCRYIGLNSSAADASPDVLGDAQRLPFRDGVADMVFSTQVAEHLPEPHLMFVEAYRVLRPGGVLILTAPFHWPLHEEPLDYFRFTRYGLERLVRAAGFGKVQLVEDGGDWSQICCYICLKLPGRVMAPARFMVNLLGVGLDRLFPASSCPLNYTVRAEK